MPPWAGSHLAQQLQAADETLQRKAERCAARQVEWADGPLVQAMKAGEALLIDELNLAEDAVLERLNRCLAAFGSLSAICMTCCSVKPADGAVLERLHRWQAVTCYLVASSLTCCSPGWSLDGRN